ncbi:ankyrin repeat domain-containing protein 2-like [Brachionichthys hirsutus]|uniref:ankyrin repeat domain-containing protein 2-like n=1 Tax=Brachionichthys hirsutus TaxID=412623 RepID=UPI003604F8EE
MLPEMGELVPWTACLMDHKTGIPKEAQVEERVRRTSSDPLYDIRDVGGGENIDEMRKEEKINNALSPKASVENVPENAAEFIKAASQGKLNVIDKYLADGGNPNVYDELKRTPLHLAALEGHAAVVRMLLDKGADINFEDQLGSRAIHWACRGGRLGVVKALKSLGADLNVRDKLHSTPLHVATRTGHAAIVEYLLSYGAKINSRDREGDTALHDAVRLNRYRILKLLIVAGADTEIENHEGVTAVQQVKQWQVGIMETLKRLEKLKEVAVDTP